MLLLPLANADWLELTPEQRLEMWKQTSVDFPRDAMKPHTEGFAADRFSPPPKPGEHPRVFISPSDLPDLRRRLKETKTGRICFETIKKFLDEQRSNESNASAFADKMIGRSLTLDQYDTYDKGAKTALGLYLMYESFRCLVEDDKDGGKKVAKQLAAYAHYVYWDLDKNGIKKKACLHPDLLKIGLEKGIPFTENDWQGNIQDRVQHMNLALAYDFAFNFMNDEQRDTTRKMISKETYNGNAIGMGLYTPNGHNWHVFHTHLGMAALAIEGEEGYDKRVTDWSVDNLKTYFAYSIYESGTPNERQGKGTMDPTFCIPYQKRGYNMLTIPNIYNTAAGYELNMMEPWGTVMVYGAWGGSGLSFSRWMDNNAVLKYAFPKDPVIDFIWRRSVGDGYDVLKDMAKVSFHYAAYEKLLMISIFAQDYDSKLSSWEEQYKSLDKPLSWFCPQRALMIARSDYTTNALQLYLHCQQYYSAHPRFGRGKFQLNGLGRPWSYYARVADSGGPLGSAADAKHFSVVMIDDVGTGYEPCPMVRYDAGKDAAFATADVKFGFSWGGKEKKSPAYHQSARKYGEWMPLYKPSFDFPGINQIGSKRAGWMIAGDFQDSWLFPRFPVQRAFRTAGLVRGKYPYALIIDDCQKDDEKHLYKWIMPVQPDLYILKTEKDSIVLAENDGNRRLLIRLIDIKGGDASGAYIETAAGFGWSDRIFEHWQENRLILPAYSAAPDFKILLYPFTEGAELPETSLRDGKMEIAWGDQKDEYSLSRTKEGATTFTLERGGKELLKLSEPVEVKEYLEEYKEMKE